MRRFGMFIVLSAAILLQGCTFLPGMSAHYYKSEVVDATPDKPDAVNYTLFKITPALVQEMNDELKAKEAKPVGTGAFANPSSATYKLGPQDVLRIFVWGNPDLSPVVTTIAAANVASTPLGRTINEKGNLYFPMVGNIKAAGLTVSEFREALTQRLGKFIKDPQIDVDVAGFRSQKVFVAGEVKSSGIVPITDQPMRITDAIGLAGGLTQEADLHDMSLTRGKLKQTIDLNRIYFKGDTSANLILQNGDVIGIPDRQQRKLFILGELGNAAGINQSRSYVMRRGQMSLAEVIADAGGLNPFSSAPAKVYVMRANTEDEPVIYRLDGSNAVSLVLAEQFPMKPRDVVFVSPTDITEFGRFIGQFFPVTSGVSAVANTPF